MSHDNAIIGDTRIWDSLEILYMLRSYEFFSSKDILPHDPYHLTREKANRTLNKIAKKMNKIHNEHEFSSRIASLSALAEALYPDPENRRIHDFMRSLSITEFFSMRSACQDTRTWISRLREVNKSRRNWFFSVMGHYFTTMPLRTDLTIANQTLTSMLNMLSSYKFDSSMKASTSWTSTTMATIPASTSNEVQEKEKWSLNSEVRALFDKALQNASFEPGCMMLWEEGYGEFQCDNVLYLWPEIRERKRRNNNIYRGINGPLDVGKRIKDKLVSLKSPMIEGEPRLSDVGIVTFKLSGIWVAKKIHTMLRDGIEKWAPRQQFTTKSTIVYSPSWDDSILMPMDVLRRQILIMSQMHMLEYVKSAATTSSGNGWSLTNGELEKYFQIVEKAGEVLISPKDEEKNTEPLVRGKSRWETRGKTHGESESVGYPLEDLAALWHGLVENQADFILCVAPTQQQGYVEECVGAAFHAGWMTVDYLRPTATYVGFKTCSLSLESLLSFLYSACLPREAGEAAKVLRYTDEAVLDCALTYTFLKYHRLADCKFSYTEMLDVEGDTFTHLLITQAQIREITDHHRQEIDELKKASELRFDEVWSVDVLREWGLHLLMFTDLINESYASILPHLLCRYLYDLSKKFRSSYETFVLKNSCSDTHFLLLCEATAIVMKKGFHLLGISKKPSIKAVTTALILSYVAPLDIPIPLNPIRTRFEMFTIYVNILRDPEFRDGELFGWIDVSDNYGLLPDGYSKTLHPGPFHVTLLSHDPPSASKIRNNGRIEIRNPSSRHSVPFSYVMQTNMELCVVTKEKDDIFDVCDFDQTLDFSAFLDGDSAASAYCLTASGGDGNIRMHCVLLRDALDSTIEVNLQLDKVSSRRAYCRMLAHYGDMDLGCGEDILVKSCYWAVLFESSTLLENGVMTLTRSQLAVPNNGSLVIEVYATDLKGAEIFGGTCKFSSLCAGGCFSEHIKNDSKKNEDLFTVNINCS